MATTTHQVSANDPNATPGVPFAWGTVAWTGSLLIASYAPLLAGLVKQWATDEDMGHIVDVIVDRTGSVRAAVIDFGGFLGVGSRKIVVDWNALHFGRVANKGDAITLELTKNQVMAAPEYKEDAPIVVLGASGTLQPFSP